MTAIMDTSITIDQLLRAAKLIEQNTLGMQLADRHPMSIGTSEAMRNDHNNQLLLKSLYKLGEDYQSRVVASKLRGVNYADSTGSSQRSSPTSMISSCPSSAPGSPISHPSIVVSSALCSTSPSGNAGFINNSQSLGIHHQLQILSPLMGAGSPSLAAAEAAEKSGAVAATSRSNRSSISLGTSASPSASSHSTRQSRAAHNELEKNRRANLRGYLDTLKLVLPAEVDTSRDTTLSLLTRARNYIQELKSRKEEMLARRSKLVEENLRLQEALDSAEQTTATVAPLVEVPMSSCEFNSSSPSAFSPVVSKPCVPRTSDEQTTTAATVSTPPASSVVERLADMSLEELLMEGLLPAPSMLPLLYPYNSYTAIRAQEGR